MTVRYVQSPTVADVLHADGEALVLVDESLLRLGTLASEVLACCTQPRTLAEVVDHCLAILGPAPDGEAEAAVDAAIGQLNDNSVLMRVE